MTSRHRKPQAVYFYLFSAFLDLWSWRQTSIPQNLSDTSPSRHLIQSVSCSCGPLQPLHRKYGATSSTQRFRSAIKIYRMAISLCLTSGEPRQFTTDPQGALPVGFYVERRFPWRPELYFSSPYKPHSWEGGKRAGTSGLFFISLTTTNHDAWSWSTVYLQIIAEQHGSHWVWR
jgi:hypothetical protein